MDEFELRRTIYEDIREICHYSQMQVFATSPYQQKYFQLQIDEAINGLINLMIDRDELLYQQNLLARQVVMIEKEELPAAEERNSGSMQAEEAQREITAEELAFSDGSEGKPAYVAVNGNVYDVSMAIRWAGGTHFGLYAGHDLTKEFDSCHKSIYDILKILPIVGRLKK